MYIAEGVRSSGEYALWHGREYEVGKSKGDILSLQVFAEQMPGPGWREVGLDPDRGRRFVIDVPVSEVQSWVAVTAVAEWEGHQLGIRGLGKDGTVAGYLNLDDGDPFAESAKAQGVRLTVRGPSWTEAEVPLSALSNVRELKVFDVLERRKARKSKGLDGGG